jgi:hypothetical protein
MMPCHLFLVNGVPWSESEFCNHYYCDYIDYRTVGRQGPSLRPRYSKSITEWHIKHITWRPSRSHSSRRSSADRAPRPAGTRQARRNRRRAPPRIAADSEFLQFSSTRFMSRSLTLLSFGTAPLPQNAVSSAHWPSAQFVSSAMGCCELPFPGIDRTAGVETGRARTQLELTQEFRTARRIGP